MLIGSTPMLAIEFDFRGRSCTIFAKCEYLNMTGSIKDRMALEIFRSAYASGSIRPGDTVAEATSGNTGISFAAIGSALGHPVTIFMPDWMSIERTQLISRYGAHIVPVSRDQGGFLGSIRMSEDLAASREDVFLPCQFSNKANVEAHRKGTAREIWNQLQRQSLRPDAFVAGVGTGGTVMGVGKFMREKDPNFRVHPVEPAESPTLSTGKKIGHHRIQGISDEFIPSIVDLDFLNSTIAVADGDAILMAQKLAANLGVAVGISSGCNFLAALHVADELGPDAVVVTVFADDNKKYLSTALTQDEPVRDDYLSPQVKLRRFRVFPCDRETSAETI